MMLALAWRNLWRNRQRTLLTAGAIAFAVFLLVFVMAIKTGQYASMIDSATRLEVGHLQIQDKRYLDDPRLRFVVGNVGNLTQRIAALPGVRAVFPRAQTFALVSVGERSFGGLITAVDPTAERRFSTLPGLISTGRYIGGARAQEAVIGALLARNLGITPGAEIVILGSGRNDSVAALVVTVVGLLETGVAEVDRSFVQIPLAIFRDAFELDDEANMLVVLAKDVSSASALAQSLAVTAPRLAVRPWQQLLPELRQVVELNRLESAIFLVLLAFTVTFSIVNTFVMTVFERTREFGMLLAMGMRPGQVQRMLQLEALMLCALGIGIGALAGLALTWQLARVGFLLPIADNEMLRRFHMPQRIFPAFEAIDLWLPVLGMLVATQLAAFIPSLRLRRLQPVQALRAT